MTTIFPSFDYENIVLFIIMIIFEFMSIFLSGNLASDIALKAVKTVLREDYDKKEIDIKNYAKVVKVSSLLLLVPQL